MSGPAELNRAIERLNRGERVPLKRRELSYPMR